MAYDGLVDIPAHHAAPADVPQSPPAAPHQLTPQVPVASETVATHQVAPDPAFQLFQFLCIFAVPVRVSVPSTYIANPEGFNITPVLTVKF